MGTTKAETFTHLSHQGPVPLDTHYVDVPPSPRSRQCVLWKAGGVLGRALVPASSNVIPPSQAHEYTTLRVMVEANVSHDLPHYVEA